MTPQTNFTLEIAPNRNYLKKDDKRVKMISQKYIELPIDVLSKAVHNLKKIRLQNIEKFFLEYELFKNDLKINDKFVFEIVKNLTPLNVREVNVKHKDINKRFELVYSNGYYIKISKALYDLHPEKKTKYSNF